MISNTRLDYLLEQEFLWAARNSTLFALPQDGAHQQVAVEIYAEDLNQTEIFAKLEEYLQLWFKGGGVGGSKLQNVNRMAIDNVQLLDPNWLNWLDS